MVRKQFPAEGEQVAAVADLFQRILGHVEPNSTREGLNETPMRAAKALLDATSGYDQDPFEVLKVFGDGAEGYDEVVLVKDIPFYSKCEHHLETIIGRASIGYIPTGAIVGLSKLARVTDVFARRLQVQERMTVEIAGVLQTALKPRGVAVQIRARHMCIESRGICKHGTVTTTNCLLGVFREQSDARAEIMSMLASDAAI